MSSLIRLFWFVAPWPTLLLALVSCAPLPQTPDQPTQPLPPITWPTGDRYTIDRTRSEFRVELTAEGPLARFGHPHVIGTQTITGQVVVPPRWQQTAFKIAFEVDDLVVDPPRWRAEAGLEADIPQDDIDATETNMRSPAQLDANAHPGVQLQSRAITGTRHEPTISVDVAIAGRVSQQALPVKVHWGDGELIISGQTTWRLTELGIEPFSVFGGGLRVGDEIRLRVRLYAVAGSDQSMPD